MAVADAAEGGLDLSGEPSLTVREDPPDALASGVALAGDVQQDLTRHVG